MGIEMSSTAATITMYRPVGQAELDLIRAAGMKAFPPRLVHQPIFYPVENESSATQIARDWNTRDGASGFVGSAVARQLTEAGFTVRALVRGHSPRTHLAGIHLEYVEGDLRQHTWTTQTGENRHRLDLIASDIKPATIGFVPAKLRTGAQAST